MAFCPPSKLAHAVVDDAPPLIAEARLSRLPTMISFDYNAAHDIARMLPARMFLSPLFIDRFEEYYLHDHLPYLFSIILLTYIWSRASTPPEAQHNTGASLPSYTPSHHLREYIIGLEHEEGVVIPRMR